MDDIVATLPLPIGGGLSAEPMEKLIAQELEIKEALKERGYTSRRCSVHIPVSSINPFTVYTNYTDGNI